MILATIEKHKQNSETFKAFNSSVCRDEQHTSNTQVNTCHIYSYYIFITVYMFNVRLTLFFVKCQLKSSLSEQGI